jgi:hypothetical protein
MLLCSDWPQPQSPIGHFPVGALGEFCWHRPTSLPTRFDLSLCIVVVASLEALFEAEQAKLLLRSRHFEKFALLLGFQQGAHPRRSIRRADATGTSRNSPIHRELPLRCPFHSW